MTTAVLRALRGSLTPTFGGWTIPVSTSWCSRPSSPVPSTAGRECTGKSIYSLMAVPCTGKSTYSLMAVSFSVD